MEALYVGTPVVAYDLPVLRETCGDAAVYVTPGDVVGLRGQVIAMTKLGSDRVNAMDLKRIQTMMHIDTRADHIEDVLRRYLSMPQPTSLYRSAIGLSLVARIRSRFRKCRIHISNSLNTGLTKNTIEGWVYNPAGIYSVEAIADSETTVSVRFGLSRPDVIRRFPELGHQDVGFEIDLPKEHSFESLRLIARGYDGTSNQRKVTLATAGSPICT